MSLQTPKTRMGIRYKSHRASIAKAPNATAPVLNQTSNLVMDYTLIETVFCAVVPVRSTMVQNCYQDT